VTTYKIILQDPVSK